MLVIGACKDPPSGSVDPFGDTDAVMTSGPVMCGDDGDDGVDDTGDGDIEATCLTNSSSSETLIKHQCNGGYNLEIVLDVDPHIGPNYTLTIPANSFGVGTIHWPYEDAPVAVCCSDIRDLEGWCAEGMNTCGTLHHKFCYLDMIAHACRTIGPWIKKKAEDDIVSGNGRQAVLGAAEWFSSNAGRQECFEHFWLGEDDDLQNEDYCDDEKFFNFEHTPWEPDETWSVQQSVVSGPKISLQTQTGSDFVLPPPTEPVECSGPYTNAGPSAPYPTSTTPWGPWLVPLDPIPVDLDGPEWNAQNIVGMGMFGDDSLLRVVEDGGNLRIFNWSLLADGPTSVGTSAVQADVSSFRMDLMGEATATPIMSNRFRLAAGKAVFDMTATVDGSHSDLQVVNTSHINFSVVSGGVSGCPFWASYCIRTAPFTIEYQDPDQDIWELYIDEAWWPDGLSFGP